MPDLEIGDETTKVFVNPYDDTKDLAEETKAFFEYLKEELTQSNLTKKLYEEVEKVSENKEWRREYMAWISELEESKEEAREAERGNGNQYAEGQYADIQNYTILKAPGIPHTGITTKPSRKLIYHQFTTFK